MNEEEKRKYEAFQYWIQTNTEKGVTTIPDNLCLFVVNLIKSLQKENEELKDKYATFVKMSSEVNARFISVKKVKDEIEELENYIQENSDEQGYWGNINPDIIYKEIDVLQELLEEDK